MKKIEILSKTGREGRYTLANIQHLRDNKIFFKALPDGTYKVVAKWGYDYIPEKTEIIITSMTPTAKAMIKDSLLLNHFGHKQKVFWVEDKSI